MPNASPSQAAVTDAVRHALSGVGPVRTPEDLARLRALVFDRLEILPWNARARAAEAAIRWKRTGSKILEDGYVYDTKYCTDVVVLFCTLCRARGIPTRFVKLVRDGGKTHSVAEARLPDGWYWFDVALSPRPVRGEIDDRWVYRGWRIWKKGRDAWDLGLTDIDALRRQRSA